MHTQCFYAVGTLTLSPSSTPRVSLFLSLSLSLTPVNIDRGDARGSAENLRSDVGKEKGRRKILGRGADAPVGCPSLLASKTHRKGFQYLERILLRFIL